MAPAIYRAFRPDLSSVPPYDALNRGKTDTASREFPRSVKALKRSEKLPHICHIKAYPIVAHVIDVLTGLAVNVRGGFRQHTEFYLGVLQIAREFPRIPYEVFPVPL